MTVLLFCPPCFRAKSYSTMSLPLYMFTPQFDREMIDPVLDYRVNRDY